MYITIQPAQQAWAQLGQPDLQVGLHTLVEVAPIHEDGLQLGLQLGKSWGKPWDNDEKIHSKWENHGKIMGFSHF